MTVRSRLFAFSFGFMSLLPVSSGFLPTQYLPIYGGSGGSGFTRSCGAGKVLTGFTYRDGLAVDAIGLLCRPVSANGSLGSESTVGTLAGGGGGTSGSWSCPSDQVITQVRIAYGTYVNEVLAWCQKWNASTRSFSGTKTIPLSGAGSYPTLGGTSRVEECEAATQPAVGIRGRAHSLVDALGFICDEP